MTGTSHTTHAYVIKPETSSTKNQIHIKIQFMRDHAVNEISEGGRRARSTTRRNLRINIKICFILNLDAEKLSDKASVFL